MEKQLTDKSLVPVAYQVRMSDGRWGTIFHHPDKPLGDHRPLYAHPPQPSETVAEAIATREVFDRREAVPVAWRYRDARNVKSKWTVQKNRPDWWKGNGPDGYVLEPLYVCPSQPSKMVAELVAACEPLLSSMMMWTESADDTENVILTVGTVRRIRAALAAMEASHDPR